MASVELSSTARRNLHQTEGLVQEDTVILLQIPLDLIGMQGLLIPSHTLIEGRQSAVQIGISVIFLGSLLIVLHGIRGPSSRRAGIPHQTVKLIQLLQIGIILFQMWQHRFQQFYQILCGAVLLLLNHGTKKTYGIAFRIHFLIPVCDLLHFRIGLHAKETFRHGIVGLCHIGVDIHGALRIFQCLLKQPQTEAAFGSDIGGLETLRCP